MRRPKVAKKITTLATFFWPTSDQWHPNFPRDTVLVRLSEQKTGEESFIRLSVWGADDDGMERDWFAHNRTEIKQSLLEAKRLTADLPNPLTKRWLTEHGFMRA